MIVQTQDLLPGLHKQIMYKFIRQLNDQLIRVYISFRKQVENNPPSASQIPDKLERWKKHLQNVTDKTLNNYNIPEKQRNIEVLCSNIEQKFGDCQKFNELMRCVQSTVNEIKQLLRALMLKVPEYTSMLEVEDCDVCEI